MQRLGIDPFTGLPWADSTAFGGGLTFASQGNIYAYTPNPVYPAAGAKNSNIAQVWFQQYGLNSSNGFSGTTLGSSSPASGLGFSNLNGMQILGATFQHWMSDNVRFGVYAIHVNEAPGVEIPVGSFGGPNSCRGCFVSGFSTNYIYLDSWLFFKSRNRDNTIECLNAYRLPPVRSDLFGGKEECSSRERWLRKGSSCCSTIG
jgi:hypothetical protein